MDAVLLAVALAMDATAVAAARAVTGLDRRGALMLATSFGVFQAGMSAIGWALGQGAQRYISTWDHWLAFALLVLIGGKMLVEAVRDHDDQAAAALDLRTLLVLSIATSIDALAAGITLPTLGTPPAIALTWIGAASFVLPLAGAKVGAALGAKLGKPLEVLGGLTLIGIGVKTLVEHL